MPKHRSQLTKQQVDEWTSSFDKLLSSEQGRDLFREHLLHLGRENDLEFWQDCMTMKENYNVFRTKAVTIFETYLEVASPKQVNVLNEAEVVRSHLEEKRFQDCAVFDNAMYKVRSRMEQQSFPEFRNQLLKQVSMSGKN